MKLMFGLLAFSFSSLAYAANPFAAFSGSYLPEGAPSVVMGEGMKYCNQHNFRFNSGFEVSEVEGAYRAELRASSSGVRLSSFIDFREYDYSDAFGVKNVAMILGGTDRAVYEVMNTSPRTADRLSYFLQSSGDRVQLTIETEFFEEGRRTKNCRYFVGLRKIQ